MDKPVESSVGLQSRIANNPLIAPLSGLAAPLTIVVASMLYLCGASERTLFFKEFGMRPLPQVSIQDTMVIGYMPLLLGLLAFSLVIGLGVLIDKLHLKLMPWFIQAFEEVGGGSRLQNLFALLVNWNLLSYRVSLVLLTLLAAAVSGGVAGQLQGFSVKSKVDNNCAEDCFRYYTSSTSYIGILLGLDAANAVIYTKTGVILLKTDAVVRIESLASKQKPGVR